MSEEVKTIICIPGPWKDRAEFVQSIAKNSDGYLFAGQVLRCDETGDVFELDFCPRDERMLNAFHASGPHWSNTAEMKRIDDHESVVYIIGKTGSMKAVHSMMDAVNGLLKAGGFAVKIETTGLAHTPGHWQKYCNEKHLFSAHTAFVIYVTGDHIYSCGMHNLGLPDAIVQASETENATELLRCFTQYLFVENPEIISGQTFSASEDAPVYEVLKHEGINYGEGSLFTNPFGAWYLKLCG